MTVYDTTGTEHTMKWRGDYLNAQAYCSCGWQSKVGHWYDVRMEGRMHQHESDTFCLGCFEHFQQHREGCEGVRHTVVA